MRHVCQSAYSHLSRPLFFWSCSFAVLYVASERSCVLSPSSLLSSLLSRCRSTFPDGASCFVVMEHLSIGLHAGTRTIARESGHSSFGHARQRSRQVIEPWSVRQRRVTRQPFTRLASDSSMATMFP